MIETTDKSWSDDNMPHKITSSLIAIALLTGACAPQYVEREAASAQDVPVRTAFFSANPESLHDAFKDACNSPGEKFSQPNRETAICRIPPSPRAAAFLLAEFDGKLEAPWLVIQKQSFAEDENVRVELSYYAEVAQKNGTLRRIYLNSRDIDRMIDLMLRNSGGTLSAG